MAQTTEQLDALGRLSAVPGDRTASAQPREIRLGQRSWFEWVRAGSVGALAKAITQARPPSRRSERMKQRILHCLEPLTRTVPQAPLREPIQDPALLRAVFERAVHSMTQLRMVN